MITTVTEEIKEIEEDGTSATTLSFTKPASAATSNTSNSTNSTNTGTNATYIALRKGKHVKNCIFVSWDDAQEHLLHCDHAEYRTYAKIEDAIQYVSSSSAVHHGNSHGSAHNQVVGLHSDNDILPLLALKTYRQKFSTGTGAGTGTGTGTGLGNKHGNGHNNKHSHEEEEYYEEEDDEDEDMTSSHSSSPSHSQSQSHKRRRLTSTNSEEYGESYDDDKSGFFSSDPLPKETETVELDGRIVYKRRPSRNWMAMYKRLQEYRRKTGSFYINPNDKDNISLKRWISEQKHQYKCFKTGKKHFTSQMKIQLLAEIGFDFEFHSFDARLEQLLKYKEEHGNVDVPFDDPFLGKWMETQRRQLALYKKGKESKLDELKVQKLRQIGVDIEKVMKPNIRPRQETNEMVQKWDLMFQKMVEFSNKFGHCQVLRSDVENQELYKWVCVQRLEYKKLKNNQGSKMTASRLQKLNDIGFIFNPRPAYMKWEDRMDQLREFKEKHGHLRVPVTDPEIGEFVARQRVEYAKLMMGKPSGMTQDRADALTSIGFIFQVGKRRTTEMKTVRKTWDERYQELIQFKEIHGHTLVPQSNSTLGEWVHKQRKNYKLLKHGKPCPLTTERALKLADIGFIFDASGYRRGRKDPIIGQIPPVHIPPVPDPYNQTEIMDMTNL